MNSREAFEAAWPRIVIPGEFDGMDSTDQSRWRGALLQAFEFGIQHARDVAVKVCEAIEAEEFRQYKGRPPKETLVPSKAYNPHTEGMSDGAGLCAAAIKEALK